MREQVVETLQDVRRLAVELRPKALDDFGLVPALERLTQTFAEQTGLAVDLEAQLGERAPAERRRDGALPDRAGGADQHRQARRARAASASSSPARGRAVTAVIEDDGAGFDSTAAARGARARSACASGSALVGGKLKIESRLAPERRSSARCRCHERSAS